MSNFFGNKKVAQRVIWAYTTNVGRNGQTPYDRYNFFSLAMANPASTGILLTPDTYLNHLPKDEAAQFEVVRGVYIVFLGVSISRTEPRRVISI